YESVTDEEALEAFQALARLEGLMPALESAHAVAYAMRAARRMRKSEVVVVGLSGRGDKDVHTAADALADGNGAAGRACRRPRGRRSPGRDRAASMRRSLPSGRAASAPWWRTSPRAIRRWRRAAGSSPRPPAEAPT